MLGAANGSGKIHWFFSDEDGLKVRYDYRFIIFSDYNARKTEQGMKKEVQWFCKRYEGCSLVTFLYLLLNPGSDYYRIFSKKTDFFDFYFNCSIGALMQELFDRRLLIVASDSHMHRIREAMHVFATYAYALRYGSPESVVIRLVDFWAHPAETKSRLELTVSSIAEVMKIGALPQEVKDRIVGFLDLSRILEIIMQEMSCHQETDVLSPSVKTFAEVFRRVLQGTNHAHQANLLANLADYGLSVRRLQPLGKEVILSILAYPPSDLRIPLSAAFLMSAVRMICQVSQDDCSDDHSAAQQLMGFFEVFDSRLEDLRRGSSPEKTQALLMRFIDACSGFLDHLKRQISWTKMASLLFLFTRSAPCHEVRFFLETWLDRVDECVRLEIFGQLLIRPYVAKVWPHITFKRFESLVVLQELYAGGENFPDLLKPRAEKSKDLAVKSMIGGLEKIFTPQPGSLGGIPGVKGVLASEWRVFKG